MTSKNSYFLALFFALNILVFTLTAAIDCGCTPSPCVPSPCVPCPSVPCPSAPCPLVPSPSVPCPSAPCPLVPSPSVPCPSVPCPSVPIPNPGPVTPPITHVSSGYCPIDTLKLGVCTDVISTRVNVQLGQPSSQPCCSLIHGLIDLDAAFCFCTALKANVLGMNIDIPISLSVLLNFCKRKVPYGFECA